MITEVKSERVEIVSVDEQDAVEVGEETFFGPASRMEVEISAKRETRPGAEVATPSTRQRGPNNLFEEMAEQSLKRALKFGDSVGAWIDAGASALAARDPDGAKRAFNQVLDVDPLNRRAILGLSRALKESGDVEKAVEQLRALFERESNDVETRVSLAIALVSAGRRAEAHELLSIDVPSTPSFAGLLAARGAMRIDRGETSEAIADLRKAVRLRPSWVYARNALGIAESRSGNRRGAEQRFREAIRTSPAYPGAFLSLATLLAHDGRWNEILDVAERYWSPQTAPFALAVRVGVAALKSGNPRIARDWLEKAVGKASDNLERAWALNDLGVSYDALGKNEDAERCFLESIDEHPSDIAVANVGKVLLERGEAEAAAAWLQRAEEFCTPGTSMRHTLAVALLQCEQVAEAIDVARELIERPDADKWSFALLGSLYVDGSQQYADAVNVLREGLARWPKDTVLQNNLCYALILDDRLDEAEALLRNLADSVLNESERTYVTATRGLLALRRGDTATGWTLYEEAASIAGRASVRERVKVKRDLEMARALERLGAPPSTIRPYLERAAGGSTVARPYTLHAAAELRRLGAGTSRVDSR